MSDKKHQIAPGFESDGEFEFSGKKPNEIIRLSGRLVIGKNGLTTVTFMGINQSPIISDSQKIPLIKGWIDKQTTGKIHVSLFDCNFRMLFLNLAATAQHKCQLMTTNAFFDSGSHFNSNEVSVIGFTTDKLHNWLWSAQGDTQQVKLLGKSGRELKRDNRSKIRYFKVPIMYLDKGYDINLELEKIKVSFHTALRNRPFYHTSDELVIPTDSYVRIQFSHKKDIGHAREIVFRINQLLSFLSFKFHAINELFTEYPLHNRIAGKTVKYTSEVSIVDYSIIASRIDRPQNTSYFFQAFKFVKVDLKNIIEQWFVSYELLESIINTLIPRYDPEVIKSHTMIFYTELVKSIEAYGRKKHNLISGSQSCVQDSIRRVFKQCAANKIEEIFSADLIKNLGIVNRNINKRINSLVDKLCDVRNIITHQDKTQLSKIPPWLIANSTLNPIRIYELNGKLQLFLLYLLCIELGFENKFNLNNLKVFNEITDD